MPWDLAPPSPQNSSRPAAPKDPQGCPEHTPEEAVALGKIWMEGVLAVTWQTAHLLPHACDPSSDGNGEEASLRLRD